MERAYYWNAKPNFGDALTRVLLHAFSGIDVQHAKPEDAEIVVVGSVLESLPVGWSGIVAGAGKMFESSRPHLDKATIYGLRGHLSARGVPGDYVLGDPALLADELTSVPEKRYNLGVVPHWSDHKLLHRFTQYNPYLISPMQDPITAIREIANCKKIVASSLHGIIVADAFGIPRRAEFFERAVQEGGTFKFSDYSSVIGQPIEFGKLQSPNRARIEAIQRELFDMFQLLKGLG